LDLPEQGVCLPDKQPETGRWMYPSIARDFADFNHLRRWRKSVEQAQSYTFKAVITIIVSGLLGAAWMGIKIALGK